jgi:ribosome-binding protein aMBF1 (putative translation factor)
MRECFKCGVGEDKAFLYQGISKEGIINVCKKCFHKSEIPVIEKKTLPKDFDPGKRESVRQRLVQLAGLKEDKFDMEREMRKLLEKKEDTTLNDIVEKNFKKNLPEKSEKNEELIDNFHWVLMRKRRSKKMTQSEVAKELFEPVAAIEAAERGVLPRDYMGLIKKFERYYDIILLNTKIGTHFNPARIAEESKISSGVTIGDLRKLTPGEEEIIDSYEEEVKPDDLDLKKVEEVVGRPVESENRFSKGISQEEMDDILFGGK